MEPAFAMLRRAGAEPERFREQAFNV